MNQTEERPCGRAEIAGGSWWGHAANLQVKDVHGKAYISTGVKAYQPHWLTGIVFTHIFFVWKLNEFADG